MTSRVDIWIKELTSTPPNLDTLNQLLNENCKPGVGFERIDINDPVLHKHMIYTPFMYAIDTNNRELIHFLINRGADIYRSIPGGENGYSRKIGTKLTPLYVAAEKGNIEIVKMLLDNCVDPNKTSTIRDSISSPLMVASGGGHYDVVKLLIEGGANINFKGSLGYTALHVASAAKYANVIDLLIKNGADINAKTTLSHQGENTPLMYAAMNDPFSIIAAYMREDKPLPPDSAIDCVKVLLEAGADTTIRNSRRETAHDIANTPEIKRILKSYKNIRSKEIHNIIKNAEPNSHLYKLPLNLAPVIAEYATGVQPKLYKGTRKTPKFRKFRKFRKSRKLH